MKKIIFLFLLAWINVNAQKELWGVSQQTPYPAGEQGNIVKFDMNGENAMTIHHFNYTTGKVPMGKLFLASNGKLYGTAAYGGIGSTTATYEQDGYGVLYEYDLTFDTYRVVHYFNSTSPTDVTINPTSSLIEPIPDKLYGGTRWGNFYVYDIATETVTSLDQTYSLEAMGFIYSDMIKASNGFVYAVSASSYPCTGTGADLPNQGSIIKINTATNTAQRVAVFGCGSTSTINAFGGYSMVEALPNKIFFMTNSNLYIPSEGSVISVGGIIEFNTVTNGLTQKFTFDPLNSLGFRPGSFVLGDNGNLYGVCNQGGDTFRGGTTSGLFNKTGTLFEYDPTTNDIIKLTEFLPFQSNPGNIIKLTSGDLMGNIAFGSLFKYNINSNTLQFPDGLTYSDFGDQASTQNLIEICRKPSYHAFDTASLVICEGEAFSLDIQNTNATTYQWKKGSVTLVSQTTVVLAFDSLSVADTGIYTCTMTNECGITVTTPLQLTIEACLGLDKAIGMKDAVRLYPNPTGSVLNIGMPADKNIQVQKASITNMLGQVVYSNTGNTTAIHVASLSQGVYQIAVVTDRGAWNGRFVKE
ncbi:T9SS type A sorting domain-containing protein [Flavobacterium sp. DGU11]|uniref:T9SS type A sorting domain-containing protein n=1 Tax=Flavobacterium arundinis TaxID=3139143 RepID=A0ABU9HT06_9FLAO